MEANPEEREHFFQRCASFPTGILSTSLACCGRMAHPRLQYQSRAQILKRFTATDEARRAVNGDQHFSRAQTLVVGRTHDKPVRASIQHANHIAFLNERQFAVVGHDIATFTDVAHDVLHDGLADWRGRPAIDFDIVERIVHNRPHQGVETKICAGKPVFAVIFCGVDCAEQDTAFRDNVTAGLHEESTVIVVFCAPAAAPRSPL